MNIMNNDGTTPLREAVRGGLDICLDVLVKAAADVNADVNYFDGIDTTVLMDVVQYQKLNCLTILLEAGADKNISDGEGKGALHYAVYNADRKYTELLLNAGADVNIGDSFNDTALILASKYGHHQSVKLLIDAGADVNHRTGRWDTALSLASDRCQIKSMDILIKAGADVNAIDGYDSTALFTGNRRCVKVLLRADILINHFRFDGVKAIKYAALTDWGHDAAKLNLLYAAGETLKNIPKDKIPHCLRFEDCKLQLKHICRQVIRKHLLKLDPHQHLFGRIPKLELPELLNRYLLYNETLDDDESPDDDKSLDDDEVSG